MEEVYAKLFSILLIGLQAIAVLALNHLRKWLDQKSKFEFTDRVIMVFDNVARAHVLKFFESVSRRYLEDGKLTKAERAKLLQQVGEQAYIEFTRLFPNLMRELGVLFPDVEKYVKSRFEEIYDELKKNWSLLKSVSEPNGKPTDEQ